MSPSTPLGALSLSKGSGTKGHTCETLTRSPCATAQGYDRVSSASNRANAAAAVRSLGSYGVLVSSTASLRLSAGAALEDAVALLEGPVPSAAGLGVRHSCAAFWREEVRRAEACALEGKALPTRRERFGSPPTF